MEKVFITDKQGNKVLPKTHVSAVYDDEGNALDSHLGAFEDEVRGLVDTPHQEYVTVATYASLPPSGSKDTIYRVSNYNGSTSQIDTTSYSEYAWDGSQYIFLCVKSQIDEVFDITVYNNNTKYADLTAALDGGANIPQSLQKGGMSVKFIQSSDNKYVQYRLMAKSWSIRTKDWCNIENDVALIKEVLPKEDDEKEYLTVPFTSEKRYINRNSGQFAASSVAVSTDIYAIPTIDDDLYVDTSVPNGGVGVAYYSSATPTVYAEFREDFQCWANGDSMTFEKVKLVIPEGATHWAFSTRDTANFGLYKIVDGDFVQVASLSDLASLLPKQQGVANAGKFMRVGVDGILVPENFSVPSGIYYPYEDGKTLENQVQGIIEGGTTDADAIKIKLNKTLYLGTNIISPSSATYGSAWSVNGNEISYDGSNVSDFVFNAPTNDGDRYLAEVTILTSGRVGLFYLQIGNGDIVDPYNGTANLVAGFLSGGGNLKIIPIGATAFTITITLKPLTSQEGASETLVIPVNNVDACNSAASNIDGKWNVAIGPVSDTMASNINGSRSIAIGVSALRNWKHGVQNVAIGTFALNKITEGNHNVAIGSDAAYQMTKAEDNVAIGKAAMGEVNIEANRNVVIGHDALSHSYDYVPDDNVAIGYKSISATATAKQEKNVSIGSYAGQYAKAENVFIGYAAGQYVKGNYNVAIGKDAMRASGSVDGTNCTFVGYGASPTSGLNLTNAIGIGFGVRATKNNQCVIGNTSVSEFILGSYKLIFNNDNTVTWETIL